MELSPPVTQAGWSEYLPQEQELLRVQPRTQGQAVAGAPGRMEVL